LALFLKDIIKKYTAKIKNIVSLYDKTLVQSQIHDKTVCWVCIWLEFFGYLAPVPHEVAGGQWQKVTLAERLKNR